MLRSVMPSVQGDTGGQGHTCSSAITRTATRAWHRDKVIYACRVAPPPPITDSPTLPPHPPPIRPTTMARLTLHGARGPTPLPPYEPPYIPLSAGKILKLGTLVDGGGRQTAIDKLAKTLVDALDTLGSVVADLGELVPVGKDDHDEEQAEKQVLLDELDAMARSLVDASYKATEMKSVLVSVVTKFRDEGREARKRQREGEDEHGAAEIAGENEGLVGMYEDRLRKKIRDHGNSSMVVRWGFLVSWGGGGIYPRQINANGKLV